MRGRKKLLNRNVFFLFLIALVIFVSAFFIVTQIKSDEFLIRMDKNEYIAVCFNVAEKETLLFTELLIFDSRTNKAALFNIPGNYGSIIESLSRIERLDILFDFKKPDKMIEKIENITELAIDYYINIELDNLVKIVDLLSGIEMFIANPVENISDDEIVLLPSGSNVLDGEKILTFLKTDYDEENDNELTGKWHKFVQGLIKKTGEMSTYLENREIFDKYYSFVNTDMNRQSFMTFIKKMKSLNSERMILQRILGDRKSIDGEVLVFPYYNGNLLRETIKQTLTSISSEDIISDEELSLGLEIQNGTSIPGLAGRTAHFFTNLGYDVISTKNADRSDYDKTVVISLTDSPAAAQKVASIIRCNNIETRPEPVDTPVVIEGEDTYRQIHETDVIIILGKDFDGRYCK